MPELIDRSNQQSMWMALDVGHCDGGDVAYGDIHHHRKWNYCVGDFSVIYGQNENKFENIFE